MVETMSKLLTSSENLMHGADEHIRDDLRTLYYKYFDVQDVDTPALITVSQQLRFQVYCVENAYEKQTGNPWGIELDQYDAHAGLAVMFHKATKLAAGTVRMVLPLADDPDNSFALQAICNDPIIRDDKRFPIATTGEISRFCVPKDFRRRVADRYLTHFPNNAECDEDEWRRVIPNMTLGLIEWLVKYSVDEGLTHWCAVMEPRLLRLLTRLGIHFEPIGGLVEFHGLRQPCIIELATLLRRVEKERPDVWNVITARGWHYDSLMARI